MAIALIQTTLKIVTGTSSTTLAFTSNLGAGHLLTTCQAGFVPGGGSPSAAPNTPTDTRGHTYVGARAAFGTSASSTGRTFYVASSSSGADTVTLGMANAGDFTMVIAEWSGQAATPLGAVGEQNEATATNANPSSGTTGTLAQASELILAWVSHNGSNDTITEDTADGFVLLGENQGGSADMPIGVQYKITAATTAVTPNWTFVNSNQWYAQHVTFVAATAAAGSLPVFKRPRRIVARSK